MAAAPTVQLTPSASRPAAMPASRNVVVKTAAPAVVTNTTLPILLSARSRTVPKLRVAASSQAAKPALNGVETMHRHGEVRMAAAAGQNIVRANFTPKQNVVSADAKPRQKFVIADGTRHQRSVSQSPSRFPLARSQVASGASILCFGDSLTWGWTDSVSKPVPYGSFLEEMLGLPADSVLPAGQPGQKASNMHARLSAELSRGCCFDGRTADLAAKVTEASQKRGQGKLPEQNGRPFDVVVVLAGANDLRSGAKADAVIRDVLALHDLVRAFGAHCVAVTVTQCTANNADAKERRLINKALRDVAEASSRGSGPSLVVADFDAEVESLPKVQSDALFTDEVHFTAAGYRLLASVVNRAIAPLVSTNSAVKEHMPTRFPAKQAPQRLVAASTVVAETCITKKRPRAGSDSAAAPVRCIGRHLLYSQVPAVLCHA
eukprot:TRINITY_DN41863_c0_g1_i1.p1 TRINITY_DN41863_c0_g1~~TRINITY_DN41863_c0_g1_i1.p1  ORF type:complete len:434 (+),score=76.21 TRINITY_DN41863_c0_g1_i1:100-1401(+)